MEVHLFTENTKNEAVKSNFFLSFTVTMVSNIRVMHTHWMRKQQAGICYANAQFVQEFQSSQCQFHVVGESFACWMSLRIRDALWTQTRGASWESGKSVTLRMLIERSTGLYFHWQWSLKFCGLTETIQILPIVADLSGSPVFSCHWHFTACANAPFYTLRKRGSASGFWGSSSSSPLLRIIFVNNCKFGPPVSLKEHNSRLP